MGGESAGGHLAALVSLRLGERTKVLSDRDPVVHLPVIRAVFINYPITDVGDVGSYTFANPLLLWAYACLFNHIFILSSRR